MLVFKTIFHFFRKQYHLTNRTGICTVDSELVVELEHAQKKNLLQKVIM